MKKSLLAIVIGVLVLAALYGAMRWLKVGEESSPQQGENSSLSDTDLPTDNPATSPSDSNASTPSVPNYPQADACNQIANTNFQSTAQLDGGNSPSGPTKAYWTLRFSGSKFSYNHSDVSESGTYLCTQGKIKATLSTGTIINASYDRKSGVLIWEAHEYIKETDKPIFCGGFAGLSCPSGYACVMEGSYPDAGGTCVKQ